MKEIIILEFITCTKKMRLRGSPPALLAELAELPVLEAPVDA
jgi:hypothetical protein